MEDAGESPPGKIWCDPVMRTKTLSKLREALPKECVLNSKWKKDKVIYHKTTITSSCTFVFPGTGTGEDSSIKIHVSSSLISDMTSSGIDSCQLPVRTDHTRSLKGVYNSKIVFSCYSWKTVTFAHLTYCYTAEMLDGCMHQ